jgi:hypothetical protein
LFIASAEQYPGNLGEGKLPGTQENDIHYLQGCVYEAMGMNEQAIENLNRQLKDQRTCASNFL